ncbi:MAG: hypothetical protein SGARI_006825 [Bacillariaceae sp.]
MTLTEPYGVKIAEAVVKCGGVDALVQVSEKYCTADDQTLFSVWKTLRNLVSIKESRSLMGQNQQMKILDTAFSTLEKLKNENIKAEDTLLRIIKTLQKLVENDHFFSHGMVVMKEKRFAAQCLSLLQRETEKGKSFWIGDEECVETTIDLLIECISKGEHKLIVDSDWKAFVPFCISALLTFYDSGEVQRNAVWLLKRSVGAIDTKDTDLYAFVLENLILLLKSDRIRDSIKKDARRICDGMKEN